MKLISLYKAILELGGMSADKEGLISGQLPGSSEQARPVTIKGKRLVLPTQKQLTNSDWSDRMVFHPLYENVLRGESQVIEKLRVLITTRINLTISVLGAALLEIAGNTEEHKKLNPDQSMFLAKVRMLDKNTLEGWEQLVKSLDLTDGKQNFIHVFLKRSGVVAGKKHARVGVVTFPVMKALIEEDKVFNYKPRNKAHREVFKNLLEFIFSDILTDGAYNAGSDSTIAPYTDAMLRTFLKVIAPINDVIDLFSSVRPEIADLKFNSDWVEELDKLESYHVDIRSIPMQPGNEGTSLVKGIAPTQAEVAQPTATVQTAEVARPAAPVHAPVIPPVPSALPFNPPHQPVPGYVPNQNWMQQQQPFQHQQPVQTGVIHTPNGADFNSILNSNPALAASVANVNMMSPQQMMMMQQQRQMQEIPRWAGGLPPGGGMNPGMGGGMGMGGGYPPNPGMMVGGSRTFV